MAERLLLADRVVTGERLLAPGWLLVGGGQVVGVGEGQPAACSGEVVRLPPGASVVPGFVDGHVHGGGGAAFGSDADAALAAVSAHRRQGTTTMVASLVTDRVEALERSVAELAPLVTDGHLAGIHLEGPWLSPRHAGAHRVELLRAPTRREVDRLLDAGGGSVRMVTLAPELDGGLDAVRHLVSCGVTVAVGHTGADYATTRAALDAGARVATHLFNTMPPLHHREPGPVAALLEDPEAYVELIADGVHLHPATIRLAAGTKPRHTVLVTDAMAAAAAADGDYRLGSVQVQVRDGVARVADSGAIAGSTLTMARAVAYATRTAGLPLADVVRAATTTPAALLDLGGGVGTIRPGGRADLVALDSDLAVTRVMAGGAWVPG